MSITTPESTPTAYSCAIMGRSRMLKAATLKHSKKIWPVRSYVSRGKGEEGEEDRRFVPCASELESYKEDILPVVVTLIRHFMLILMVEKQN
jgi:hypothetical protein